ncbi:MAG: S41 family peptidase, partial [Alphaproteobacteria bacterium]
RKQKYDPILRPDNPIKVSVKDAQKYKDPQIALLIETLSGKVSLANFSLKKVEALDKVTVANAGGSKLSLKDALTEYDLAIKLAKRHYPNFGLSPTTAQLRTTHAKIRQEIEELGENPNRLKFALLLRSAIGQIGNGDTCSDLAVNAKGAYQLKLAQDAVFMDVSLKLSGKPSFHRPKVISFNGQPIDKVLSRFAKYTCGLSNSYRSAKSKAASEFVNIHTSLKGYSGQSVFTLIDVAGKTRRLSISGTAVRENGAHVGTLKILSKKSKPIDLIWQKNTPVLKISSFAGNKQSFETKLLRTLSELKRKKVKHLIIDIRDNDGGEVENAAVLEPYFTDETQPIKRFPHLKTKQISKKDLYRGKSKSEQKSDDFHLRRINKKISEASKVTKNLVIPGGVRLSETYKYTYKANFTGKIHILTNENTSSIATIFADRLAKKIKTPIYGEAANGLRDRGCEKPDLAFYLPKSKLKLQIPYDCFLIGVKSFPRKKAYKLLFRTDVRLPQKLVDYQKDHDPQLLSLIKRLPKSDDAKPATKKTRPVDHVYTLADFDKAKYLLKRHYPNYGLYPSAKQIDEKFKALRAELESGDKKLTQSKFTAKLREAVAFVGDGDTCVELPQEKPNGLHLKLLDDAVLLNVSLAKGEKLGIQDRPQVTKIDGKPVADVLADFAKFTCVHDKTSFRAKSQTAHNFNSYYKLLNGEKSEATLSVLDVEGKERELTFSKRRLKEGKKAAGTFKSLAKYKSLYPSLRFKNGIAILKVNSLTANSQRFEQRLKQIFKRLYKKNPDEFLVDLSGVEGGNIKNAEVLASYLIDVKKPLLRYPHFLNNSIVKNTVHFPKPAKEVRQLNSRLKIKNRRLLNGNKKPKNAAIPHGFRGKQTAIYNKNKVFSGALSVLVDDQTSSIATFLAAKIREHSDAEIYGSTAHGLADRVCETSDMKFKPAGSDIKMTLPYECYLTNETAFEEQDSYPTAFEPDVKIGLTNKEYFRRPEARVEKLIWALQGNDLDSPIIDLPPSKPRPPRKPFKRPSKTEFTAKMALADFDNAQTLLKRHFPNYGLYPTTKEINAVFKDIRNQIKEVGDEIEVEEFAIFLRKAFAQVGEGHTCSQIPYQSMSHYSLKLTEHKILLDGNVYRLGKKPEVLRIDGRDASEVLDELAELICIDGGNKTSARSFAAVEFSHLYYAKTQDRSTNMTILDKDGKEREIVIRDASVKENGNNIGSLTPSYYYENDRIVLKWREKKKIAVLRIPSFHNPIDEFEKALDRQFKRIKKQNPTDLIIDIRSNKGGFIKNASFLVANLINTSHRMPEYLHFKQGQFKKDSLFQPKSKKERREQEKLRKSINRWIYNGRKFQRRKIVPGGHRYNHIGKSFGKKAYNGKLHVLVDEQSFSAATLFSNVIRKK